MSVFSKEQVQDMYLLTPMQEGMLFHALLDEEHNSHLVQMSISIQGDLDVGLFTNSLHVLVERYDVFRTLFLYEKLKQPLQVVLKERPIPILFCDLTAYDEQEKQQRYTQYKRNDQEKTFHLAKDSLMRVAIFQMSESEYQIIWSFHHILMDGWCFSIIFDDLLSVYLSLKNGTPISLDPVQPYSQFIRWLEKQDKEASLAYWRDYLEQFEQQTSLPRFGKSSSNAFLPAQYRFALDRNLTQQLSAIASQNQVTLPTVIQSLWGILLQSYNGTNDVLFGSVVSGRPTEIVGIDKMVGLFINTIPFRIQAKNDQTFVDLIKDVHQRTLQSQPYEHVPLYDIQNNSVLKQDLIDHLMVIENYPLVEALQKKAATQQVGFAISEVEMFEPTNYDMTVMVMPKEEISMRFDYNAAAFDEAFIQKMAGHLKQIAACVANNPKVTLQQVTLLTETEKQQLMARNLDTSAAYPTKTMHELFMEQVERTPEQVAVVFGEQHLTYRELDEKSNQLARFLRGKGIAADSLVGTMMDRSIEMIVGILGVLKAGGAFVPIDPELPEERIAYMLEHSGIQVVVTQQHLLEKVSASTEKIDINAPVIWDESSAPVEMINHPDDLFYIIYTSGTTGKPKGVMLEHKNMANLMHFTFAKTNIDFHEKVLQYTTCSFDVCYQEIFSTLLSGGQLYLITNEMRRHVEKLFAFIQEKQISILSLPVSFLKFIFNEKDYAQSFPRCVKHIITAGEQLVVTHELQKYLRNHHVFLHNHYGPSETHVVTTYTMDPSMDIPELPPIGKPISNTGIYILDEKLQMKPEGIVGELYISGANVGRGYLHNPELTAEKFLENPYQSGERMYRTGDLARWMPDGNIEFLGRIDHQVKIRGHRIELGEIESHLLNHDSIKEAVVIDRTDETGGKYLCAYVVLSEEVSNEELRAYLSRTLPEYMIPSFFMKLERIPVTPNGKTDRRALPIPEGNAFTGADYVAPTTELEQKMAAIWESVLGVSPIGIQDNFFTLGGHSLKAIHLISRMQKDCQADVPLRVLFDRPTIQEIAKYVEGVEEGTYLAIPRVVMQEHYPVSSAQKRMLILNQLDPDSTVYNLPVVTVLDGDLNVPQLEHAISSLVNRHESLRTSFHTINGEPVQRIHPECKLPITYMAATEDRLNQVITDFMRPFDLQKAPLSRVGLVKLGERRHVLIIDMHHIISDGVSSQIILNDLAQLYQDKSLPEQRIQYKDFAVWEKGLAQTDEYRKQEAYWTERFAGEIPVLNLPLDYSRPSVQSFEGERYLFRSEKQLLDGLQRVAAETGTTLYMVLMAAYHVLLAKYSGQEDMVVGTVTAGRTHPDTESITGMFVNTLAMRNQPVATKSFKQFLREVKDNTLAAFEHGEYPFEELVEKLAVSRNRSRNPLFDTLFILQNMDANPIKIEGMTVTPYVPEGKMAKFDLSLEASQDHAGLMFCFEFCTKLFKQETIERMSRHYIQILQEVIRNTDLALYEMEMLTEQEKQELLVHFNDTFKPVQLESTLPQLFEEQVLKTPDQIALVCGDKKLTYQELNKKANQLARTLRKKGVKADQRVGIMANRSLEMVIGILAILKAGGAYVPIDPDYPNDRIAYMLEDCEARLVLTHEHLGTKIAAGVECLYLEDKSNYSRITTNLDPIHTATHLAYIIYTSGTTGKPKGVMGEHKGIVNSATWNKEELALSVHDRGLLALSFAFDAFALTFFALILSGSTVVLTKDEEAKDPIALKNLISTWSCSYTVCVPSLFQAILECSTPEEISPLKMTMLGGEKLSPKLVELCKEMNPQMITINAYGPTESSVIATYLCDALPDAPITIGRPIANTSIYIVDHSHQLLPIGVVGEICIGGLGLARGYWNKPELTEEKFVSNPFKPGERMYKTGDLGRWLPDGTIEFIGRLDEQVKVRGYRIEIGEIESVLLSYETTNEAIVVAYPDGSGDTYLTAYFTSKENISEVALRTHLSQELPAYMVPTYLIQLNAFPLTPNGKIDRKALPKPEGKPATGVEYVAPANEAEATLAKIWENVLGISDIGVMDNFFDLGGHSLKAMTVVAHVHREFQVDLSLKHFFGSPTVRALSRLIENSEAASDASIQPAEPRDYYPVSSAQQRMYLLYQLEGAGISYNTPGMIMLEGELVREQLAFALQALVDRHDIWRTSFEIVGGELVQKIHSHVKVEMEYQTAEAHQIDEIFYSFVRPFDLSVPPLIRMGLVKISDERHLLLYDMHHIAADAASVTIMFNELAELYQGRNLPEVRIQYKDFSVWQQGLFQSDAFKQQEEYWLHTFAGDISAVDLQTDYPRPAVKSFEGSHIALSTGHQLRDALLELATETKTTLFMVLLAAYNVLLSKYSGQDDIIVGTPISGRSRSELAPVVGMFVNTLAIRNKPTSEKTFKEFLMEVKQNALDAYDHQDYPFESLVEKLGIQRDPGRNPLFDTMFILQTDELDQKTLDQLVYRHYESDSAPAIAKFDLSFHMTDRETDLFLRLEYSTKLFKKDTVDRMSRHFLQILKSIAAHPDRMLQEIDMLTEEEKQLLLVEFNRTDREYAKDKTLHQLFEELAAKMPDQTALVFQGQRMSYQELNERANQLASVLREKGVEPSQIVAMLLERSLEMVIAILAILKAGGAFLPIDPEYPEERIRYMMEDSQAKLVLTHFHLIPKVTSHAEIIDLGDSRNYSPQTDNLLCINKPSDLAYIIYTSGTTGKPKGVMIEHRAIINCLQWRRDEYGFRPEDKALQVFSFAFDGFVASLFAPLLGGAVCVLPREEEAKDPIALKKLIASTGVTHYYGVPSLFQAILDCSTVADFPELRCVSLGGEKLPAQLVQKTKEKHPKIGINNEYGPTENSVVSTISRSIEPGQDITIGRPIANVKVYIVDAQHRLQPVGVVGELCIGGPGLARGYLNKPELTDEKFVANPFEPKERMYKTGDLVKWRTDGTIEYVGRADEQVKVRGYRIEIGEIESAILAYENIDQAVVVARDDGSAAGQYLCAYLVAASEVSIAELRRHLAKELPAYMVPSFFIQLDKMPLTPNDKVDRKALPKPSQDDNSGREYEAPRNELEQLLATIWTDVLGIKQVGIKDNFFELGGDSIKAIQVSTRLYASGWTLAMKELFQHPSIEEVAIHVTPNNRESDQGVVEGEIGLTPIQKWFFEQNFTDRHHWNQAVMLYREEGFDAALVQQAFHKIVEHHDALRMIYKQENGIMTQINQGLTDDRFRFYSFDVREHANSAAHILELSDLIQSSIDLEQGPLVHLALFSTEEGDHLLIAIHHLVVDGVSWRILFEDFSSAYSQALQNQEIVLPKKTDSYKDWAAQLESYAQSDELLREATYWHNLESTTTPVALPTDFVTADRKQKHTHTVKVELTALETENLLRHVHHAYHTEINDLLLTALGLTVKEWANTNCPVINLEGHGREDIQNEMNVTRTVGWFTSQFPVVLDMEKSEDLAYQIKQIKENLRRIPKKGIGYEILRTMTSSKTQLSLSFALQPEISFNYLGQFDSDVKSGGYTFSPLGTGQLFSPESERVFLLDISGLIEDGKLQISFGYSSLQYKEETITNLAYSYRNHLRRIIDHCMAKEEGELTPSDLGDDDLSMEELENILELI
ncbi:MULTISPECIES: tyrocidine non-ribosomal peptide synthetase TycB [Brevibacillus]|uniref:tyrocidine non-ribosomal peptide synthetase TycB n=1 Tax=Brevibacillus TaxID=55080 RepID=UPI000D0F21CB|nr:MULTISPECIES: tyrocidine non-ribosomal peptide synthetase TycB [Brevibacillus]MED1944045.1 tyrocidine non-ribosomal peptide synthetase TycB [Brevibacillus formosus]MED1999583.1 tyrocidine non-ribosomal peptide synthetase TycB [Brevibacillus formosus]MED2082280.1 tyrocidine non-ribosomal peptide synthetase TycB [Brevibacillus formosus]PSK18800.1 tyrocidine non-ribosomal peptide synthetase TycB [Brevibacillus sp. NRRL NRS-603]